MVAEDLEQFPSSVSVSEVSSASLCLIRPAVLTLRAAPQSSRSARRCVESSAARHTQIPAQPLRLLRFLRLFLSLLMPVPATLLFKQAQLVRIPMREDGMDLPILHVQ